MGPNFIYFGGQKYGYRPIPTDIITSELARLREVNSVFFKNISSVVFHNSGFDAFLGVVDDGK